MRMRMMVLSSCDWPKWASGSSARINQPSTNSKLDRSNVPSRPRTTTKPIRIRARFRHERKPPVAEERDDAHHLAPLDRLPDEALAFHAEPRLGAREDAAERAGVGGHEGAVGRLGARVDAKLREDVGVGGGGAVEGAGTGAWGGGRGRDGWCGGSRWGG